MDGIVKLAATVLTEIVALKRTRTTALRLVLAVVLVLLAFAAALGGLGCGMAALWIVLLPVIGPWGAPLACAGALVLIAAVLVGSGYWLLRGHRKSKTRAGALAAAIESGDFAPLIREHKWFVLALAMLAGVATADKLGKDSRRQH